MKRNIALLLAIVFLVSFTACGAKEWEEKIASLESSLTGLEEEKKELEEEKEALQTQVEKATEEGEQAEGQLKTLQEELEGLKEELEELKEGNLSQAEKSPAGTDESATKPPAASQPEVPADSGTVEITAPAAGFPVNSEKVQVTITNHTSAEFSFGMAYRLEKKEGDSWKEISLDSEVMAIAQILMPGESTLFTVTLYQNQHEYTPGTYRVTLTDGVGGANGIFQLY